MNLSQNHEEEIMIKALLVCVDTGDFNVETSLDELEELAKADGAQTVGRITQKRSAFDSATVVGEGKLEEIRDFCENNQVEVIIFDHELSGSQLRNIEKTTDVRTIDRTMLILDIFGMRAVSGEGKLQVELALERYRLTRLTGKGIEMSRLGGGAGLRTRGPGESKLETDRRHIRRRINSLEKELEALEKQRGMLRVRRKKDGVITAAIVGYTNAGKSTLLNALTDAGVLAEDKLFATLDPTSRALKLPNGQQILLIDTVGFISRLPHHLVESFKSTLEEVSSASIILHVCDAADSEAEAQIQVTNELLDELGCGAIPTVRVFNKCDLLADIPEIKTDDKTVFISAKTGFGLENMFNCIEKNLPPSARRVKLLLPYTLSAYIAKIRTSGRIFSEEFTENGTLIDAMVDLFILNDLKEYIVND